MSYSQIGINIPDPDRICVYSSGSASYYTGGTGHFGNQQWFDYAHRFMVNSIRPMIESEQKELFHNIENGTDISSLIEIGRHQAKLPLTNYITFVGTIFVFFIFLRTLFSHWRIGQLVPVKSQNPKRCSTLPVVFITGPLMFLTLLLGVVFSFGLYYTYKGILKYDHNIHKGIAERPLNLQNQMLFQAQCQYDTMFVHGSKKLLTEINDASDQVAHSCQPTVLSHIGYLEIIQRDQDSVEELLRRSELLKQQLTEAQSLNLITDAEDMNDVEYTRKTIKKIEEQLKGINKVLGERNKNTTNNLVAVKEKDVALQNEVYMITAPLEDAFTGTVNRIGQVKHSLDNATMSILGWTSKVAQRFMKAMETERAKVDPLVVYASLQGLLGVGIVTALFALGSGIIVLGLAILWPKPFYFAPRATAFVVQLFLCSLCLVSAFAFSILLLSGMFLSFAGPITSVCNTLNNFGGDNSSGFYTTNDISFELKDYHGIVHSINFGELPKSGDAIGRGLATKDVNHRVDLFPEMENEIKLDLWIAKLDDVETPEMPNFTYPLIPLGQQLKMSALALETVSFKEFRSEKARQSPLLNLVSKELQTFKRIIDQTAFKSLDPIKMPECKVVHLEDDIVDNIKIIFAQSFEELKRKMDNKFYRWDQMIETYLGSSRLLCVDYVIPSTLCWLSSLLLGLIMLVDMLIIKAITYHLLRIPAPEYFSEVETSSPGPLVDKSLLPSSETSQVSLDSPLLEEEKSFAAIGVIQA